MVDQRSVLVVCLLAGCGGLIKLGGGTSSSSSSPTPAATTASRPAPTGAPAPAPSPAAPAVAAQAAAPAPAPSAAPAEVTENDRGIPPEIVEQIRKEHFEDLTSRMTPADRAQNKKQVIGERNGDYARYRKEIERFEARWTEFAARQQVVAKAVADAKPLETAGKLDEARKLLEAAITHVARDDEGHLPKDRDRAFVEVRDAEAPAVVALFRVARAQHDWNAALGAEADLYARHVVDKDRDAERLLWLAWDRQHKLAGYNNSDERAWANQQVAAANKAADGGMTAANQLDLGVTWEMVSTETKARKGDWVLLPMLSPVKLTDKTLAYSEQVDWRTPKECHKTNRISYVDDAGGFHYEDECTYDYHSMQVFLNAELREPAPGWAPSYWNGVTLIGKVVSPGPKWKLADAIVVDTRFRQR